VSTGSAGGLEAYASGVIDDARAYNRALSPEEIEQLYAEGVSLKTNVSHRDQLTEGLVGNWTFDGKDIDLASSTKEIYDASGQGNNGDWVSHATTTAIGKIGQAIDFDGVDDYISVPNAAQFNLFPMTASAWFKSTNKNSKSIVTNYVAGSLNGFALFSQFYAGGELGAWYFGSGGDVGYTNGNITASGYFDGNWHLATFVVDSGGGYLYVDGVLKSSGTWAGSPSVSTTGQTLAIGIYPGSGNFDGAIDETRIYNRALSADEIKRLYLMGK
jgi:hypothetical protein